MTDGRAEPLFFDPTNLDEMLSFAGNPEIATRLVRRFIASAARDIAELETALAAGDLESTAFIAHRCKGAALNVGAIALGDACGRAIAAAKAAQLAASAEAVAAARDCMRPTTAAIAAWARDRMGADITETPA